MGEGDIRPQSGQFSVSEGAFWPGKGEKERLTRLIRLDFQRFHAKLRRLPKTCPQILVEPAAGPATWQVVRLRQVPFEGRWVFGQVLRTYPNTPFFCQYWKRSYTVLAAARLLGSAFHSIPVRLVHWIRPSKSEGRGDEFLDRLSVGRSVCPFLTDRLAAEFRREAVVTSENARTSPGRLRVSCQNQRRGIVTASSSSHFSCTWSLARSTRRSGQTSSMRLWLAEVFFL